MPDQPLRSELPPSFSFSQSSLQDYVDCPRRFQLRHIERMAWPAIDVEPVLENERRRLAGQQFHRMVQQHLLGLPVDKLNRLPDTPELQRWWENYRTASKELLGPAGHSVVRSEIVLTAPVGSVHLLAKYDLLVIPPSGKIRIYDWKTSRKRPSPEWLASRLQTRVYQALLVQAGAYLNGGRPIEPDQVEMVYWFAEFPQLPMSFPYSAAQYQRDWDALCGMIQEISNHRYFPTSDGDKDCGWCIYRSYCNRGIKAGQLEDLEVEMDAAEDFHLDLDRIGEIEF